MNDKETSLDIYPFIWVSIVAMLCIYSAIGLLP